MLDALNLAGFVIWPTYSALDGLENSILTLEALNDLAADQADLYDYQKHGVYFLRSRAACLLADDMGLGKTVQVLKALDAGPAVVVCPAVVKDTWKNEIARWRPDLDVFVCKNKKDVRAACACEVVILNYELLPNKWKQTPGTTIVFDEAHYLKNNRALRTQKARAAAKTAERCWLLTGTPILNAPDELWNLLQFGDMAKIAFGSWPNFVRLFSGYKTRFGMEWGEPLPQAAEGLFRVCLRRRKADVLKDLPPKAHRTHTVGLKRTDLKKGDFNAATFGQKEWTFSDLEIFSELYSRISHAKIPAMLKYIEQYELNETPLVVFSQHRSPIDALEDREGWMTIHGDTTPTKRALAVDLFQRGKLRGLGCTIQAAGTGLTLTHASNMVFVSRAFTPAVNAQAEDRINRIGQDSACLYTVLTSNHPLDLHLADVLSAKQEVIDAVVEADVVQEHLLARLKQLRNHTESWLKNHGDRHGR